MRTERYVKDLVPSYPNGALTIHGAFSHRNGGQFASGWDAIMQAGAGAIFAALVVVVSDDKDGALRGIADDLLKARATR
jgi:hypothetical protein